MQARARGRYHLLEDDGICAVGEGIQSDDIYINKSSPKVTRTTGDTSHLGNKTLPDSAYNPTPQKYKGPVGETCIVDRVLVTNNDDNCPTFKASQRLQTCDPGERYTSLQAMAIGSGSLCAREDFVASSSNGSLSRDFASQHTETGKGFHGHRASVTSTEMTPEGMCCRS